MKLSARTLTSAALVATLMTAGVAFAETGDRNTTFGGSASPSGEMRGRPEMRPGSTTPRMGSTTPRMMAEKFENRRGVAGIVTAITSNGFTIAGRGLGRNTASTTFTVIVTSNTKYHVTGMGAPRERQNGMTNSTTAQTASSTTDVPSSISSIVVGAKVEVIGKVATSTRTITADRVNVNVRGGEMKERMEKGLQGMGSGTPPFPQKENNFMNKLKKLFRGGQDNQEDGTGNGAAGEWGFMGALLSLFGLN